MKLRNCIVASALTITSLSPLMAKAMDPMTTQFFSAVDRWDEKALKKMIFTGIDINVKNDDGFTALMLAVKQKDINKIKFFVRRGADVNVCSDGGETAYSLSFAAGDEAIQKYLMLSGASAKNNCEKPLPPPPPPEYAPAPAEVEVVQAPAPQAQVVVQGQVPGGTVYVQGNVPSGTVYVQGQVPGGQVVVQGTVPVPGGQVYIQGTVPTAEVYVNAPADPPPPPHHHAPALVVPFSDYERIKATQGDAQAFFVAINKQDVAAIRYLIDHGYDINAKDKNKTTPLMQAAKQRRMIMTEAIINAYAAVNEQDDNGKTALYFAASNNDLPMVRLLMDNGADKNISCISFYSRPIDVATSTEVRDYIRSH